jgi:amino acid transporter
MQPASTNPGKGGAVRDADPAARPTLRANYLSGLENVAQTLGTMAPTGTLGVTLPLVIGLSGNGSWLLMAGVVGIYLLVSVSVNAFATRSASAGGLGTFAGLGLGPRAGTLTKWIYFGAMLFSAAGCAPSAAYYACLVISRAAGIPDTPLLGAAVTALVVAAAWWTAFRDIKLSIDVMIVIEAASLALMFAIALLAMHGSGSWVDRPQLSLEGAGPRSLGAGLVLAFVTMAGFESATTLGEEARQPSRSIPRAITACVLPVGLLYIVMTYVLVGLGRRYGIALEQLDAPFDTIARANGHPHLGTASSVGVALSYFACTLGSVNAGARTLYSLSGEGLFVASVGRAHPVNATPHRAIAIIAAFSVALPAAMLGAGVSLVSCIVIITQLASLGFIATYLMVCLAAAFYLAREGRLRWAALGASVLALVLLAGVLVQSFYPAPPFPACELPFIFAAVVAAGYMFSRWKGARRHPA